MADFIFDLAQLVFPSVNAAAKGYRDCGLFALSVSKMTRVDLPFPTRIPRFYLVYLDVSEQVSLSLSLSPLCWVFRRYQIFYSAVIIMCHARENISAEQECQASVGATRLCKLPWGWLTVRMDNRTLTEAVRSGNNTGQEMGPIERPRRVAACHCYSSPLHIDMYRRTILCQPTWLFQCK